VSFGGVNKNTVPLIQEIISSMTINIPELTSTDKNNPVPDLSAQLQLEDISPVEIDKPVELTDNWPYQDLFDCELTDVGVQLKLPGKENEYMYTIGDTKGQISNGQIKGTPENDTDKRLIIFSLAGTPVSYSISKKEKNTLDEEYIRNFKRGWSVYKEGWEFVYGSMIEANGMEWCVCITRYDSTYTGMFLTFLDGYEVMVSTTTSSKEEALKSISYIRNITR